MWVPDVRSEEFTAEAQRQSRLIADAEHAEDDQAFVDSLTADLE